MAGIKQTVRWLVFFFRVSAVAAGAVVFGIVIMGILQT